jgi:hypothetical protein
VPSTRSSRPKRKPKNTSTIAIQRPRRLETLSQSLRHRSTSWVSLALTFLFKGRQPRLMPGAPLPHAIHQQSVDISEFCTKHITLMSAIYRETCFVCTFAQRFQDGAVDLPSIIPTCLQNALEGAYSLSGRQHTSHLDLLRYALSEAHMISRTSSHKHFPSPGVTASAHSLNPSGA